jgi:hypothetical protein
MTDKPEEALRRLQVAATRGPFEADLDIFDADEGIVAIVTDLKISTIIKIETGLVIKRGDPKAEWTAEDSVRRDAVWKKAREGQEFQDAQYIAALLNAAPGLLAEVQEWRERFGK